MIAPQGPEYARELADRIKACDETIPIEVCEALALLVVQLRNLDEAIARLDRTIAKLAQQDETTRRLMSIPGVGPITASAMAASVQDIRVSQDRASSPPISASPRSRIPPEVSSDSGASQTGRSGISQIARCRRASVLFHRRPHTDPLRLWVKALIEKKPFKLVAVALANKMARIAFAILRDKTVYRGAPA